MAEDGLMEQLTGFLSSEDGMKQLQSAARMLGLNVPPQEQKQRIGQGNSSGSDRSDGSSALSGPTGGILDGMDPQVMMKMVRLMQAARQETPSSAFLRALRPLLREERRGRVDDAIRMMQLFSILPLLREMG